MTLMLGMFMVVRVLFKVDMFLREMIVPRLTQSESKLKICIAIIDCETEGCLAGSPRPDFNNLLERTEDEGLLSQVEHDVVDVAGLVGLLCHVKKGPTQDIVDGPETGAGSKWRIKFRRSYQPSSQQPIPSTLRWPSCRDEGVKWLVNAHC